MIFMSESNSIDPYLTIFTPDYNIQIDQPLTKKDIDVKRGKERARI
jgi:hypothetical protein